MTGRALKVLLITGLAVWAGCSSNAGTGALIGGGAGGLLGAGIGSMSHARAGEGALIGAAGGAIVGGLIGGAQDKKEREDREARAREDRTYTEREYRAGGYSNNSGVTTTDVISWAQRGTRDEEIIDRINRSGTVFYLTAADENRLRDSGVSEMVIRAMKDTARH